MRNFPRSLARANRAFRGCYCFCLVELSRLPEGTPDWALLLFQAKGTEYARPKDGIRTCRCSDGIIQWGRNRKCERTVVIPERFEDPPSGPHRAC